MQRRPSSPSTVALDALITHLGSLQGALVAYRASLVDRRPKHGTQRAYLLSLMAKTVLPVTPTDLASFAAAEGVWLDRKSVRSALKELQRRGEVVLVRRGRWRRVGPLE